MDRRKNPRFQTRFDALYSIGASEGAGVLTEISYSSARLDGVSLHPPIGSAIRLYIFIQPVMPFELAGSVVRHTDSGFAIEYELADPELRHLVDDVAAIVAT
jgi:hypothetical protein